MYSLLLALIYLAFISLGLPDSLLGAAWPAMYQPLGVPISAMGALTMTISAMTIISSLLSDRITRRFGTRVVTVGSVLLSALSLLGFSLSNAFWMLFLFAIPYGFSAGAIDSALNNYVALHYTSRHMSWLHCFWGVGAIIGPFIMGSALIHASWELGYRIIGFIQLGIFVVLMLTLPVWNANPPAPKTSEKALGLAGVLRTPGVPMMLLGFFAYCAAEATTMVWASTYMVEVRGFTADSAADLASLFFIGITVGRFVDGFVMNRLGDRRMIRIGTAILLLGILCLALPIASPGYTIAGFVIVGFGCAPIYPCIIHMTPAAFGRGRAGAIIGVQMASAYLGTTLIPPLYGLLGSVVGFGILPAYLGMFTILMIVMMERTFRRSEIRDEMQTK